MNRFVSLQQDCEAHQTNFHRVLFGCLQNCEIRTGADEGAKDISLLVRLVAIRFTLLIGEGWAVDMLEFAS